MKNIPSIKITRREFLFGVGVTMTGAALACGRQQGGGLIVPTDASPTSTLPPVVPAAPPERAVDLALLNGHVMTIDSADTISQAVAIKDGLIQAVDTSEHITAMVGESTQIIDLGGRTVTPGMIDAHNHFQVVGLMNGYYVPLLPPDVVTVQDLQAKLADAIAQLPEGEWVKGYCIVIQGVWPTE